MRTFVLFALTLAGLVAATSDVSAIGRKNRGRGNDCCPQPAPPCCGQGYGYGGHGGYGGHMYGAGSGYGGQMYAAGYSQTPCCGSTTGYAGGWSGGQWMGGQAVGGQWMGGQDVIRTTDGKSYVRGADGTYYSQEGGGQFDGGYPGMSGGIYRAGYPGPYYGPGVIPTGGIPPLNMPGAPVPQPMPDK